MAIAYDFHRSIMPPLTTEGGQRPWCNLLSPGRRPWSALPERADVGVLLDLPVLGDHDGISIARGGDDDLIGGVAVKGWRQPAALRQNRPRQFRQMQPSTS